MLLVGKTDTFPFIQVHSCDKSLVLSCPTTPWVAGAPFYSCSRFPTVACSPPRPIRNEKVCLSARPPALPLRRRLVTPLAHVSLFRGPLRRSEGDLVVPLASHHRPSSNRQSHRPAVQVQSPHSPDSRQEGRKEQGGRIEQGERVRVGRWSAVRPSAPNEGRCQLGAGKVSSGTSQGPPLSSAAHSRLCLVAIPPSLLQQPRSPSRQWRGLLKETLFW